MGIEPPRPHEGTLTLPITSHALMDSEHRALLAWVEEASSRLAARCSAEDALYALDVVRHLACSHFEHERAEMCAADYPDWLAHARDHHRLLEDLSRLRREAVTLPDRLGDTSRGALQARLASWLVSHVSAYDLPYAAWRQEHARRFAATDRKAPPRHPTGF